MSLSRGLPTFAPADADHPDAACTWRIDVPAAGGSAVIPVAPDAREVVVDVFPVAGERDRYGATATGMNLLLVDETVIRAPRDQYGDALDPVTQARAKKLWVDQWNRRVVRAPSAVRGIEIVIGAGHDERTVYVSLPSDTAGAMAGRSMREWVDTRRGTHSSDRFSRGNTAPIVTLPHGGVFALPMTDASSGAWPYRWQMGRGRLQAFATSHIPSPWIGDRGVFQLMPSPLADPDPSRDARSLGFDRADETARADLYRVALDGVDATAVAAEHAIGLRLHSRSNALSVIVDHLGEVTEASWGAEGDAFCVCARLDESFVHARFPAIRRSRLRIEDGDLTGSVELADLAADVVVGVSTIDPHQARRNALAAGSVADMLDRAGDAWDRVLTRVEIPNLPEVPADTIRSVAGSLARVFSYPNHHHEQTPAGPAYRSPVSGAIREGEFSANNGFWDTYRTAWPLLGLLTPHTAAQLADGFVEHARDSGWVARWSAPGPVDCMTGTTSDTVFAGLASQGIEFDIVAAARSALWHATVPSADARVGRKGLRPGIFRRYIDTDTHEGLSWTLDNAINDASAALLARRALAVTRDRRFEADARYLARRALWYREVFHPEKQFFVGRGPDGAWRDTGSDRNFDPTVWGGDYTETNAWGTRFTAPHDGAGLAALFGGEKALGRALDDAFALEETAAADRAGSYGFVIHEMSEARDVRMGMVALSNQPAHHIPFMYMFAGRHDDAHRIVTEARDRLFVGSDLGQGYPGDEDNGEMSAWYLFAVLGLYPLVPGTGEFVLTPPLLDEVRLHPEGRAHPLVITADRPGMPFVRSVTIDGETWHEIAISSERLSTARRIDFSLTDEPTGWARKSRPSSWSTRFIDAAPLRDLLAEVPQSVTDDVGSREEQLAPGDSVRASLAEAGPVSMYTVTLGAGAAALPVRPGAVRASWRVDVEHADGSVVVLDERDELFEHAAMTRPFLAPRSADDVAAVRFTALEPMTLTQLEVFA